MSPRFTDVAPVEKKIPDVASKNITDEIDMGRTGVVADVINFVYTEIIDRFFIHEGKSLYDLILEPVSGDFNRIRANGDAWRHGGQMLWSIDKNLSDNATKLRQESWQSGAASEAFINRINWIWTPGMLLGKKVCDWVGSAFDKLAEQAIALAEEAGRAISMITRRLDRLASKLGGPVGVAKALWHLFWDGELPYISDIMGIVDGIRGLLTVYENIKTLVQKAIALFEHVKELKAGFEGIAELPTVHSAVDLGKGVKEGKKKMDQLEKQYDKTEKHANEQLDDLESV